MNNKPDWDFWALLERFKSVAELIAAIIVIGPVLLAGWQFIQLGLNAVVPAWFVLITAVFAIFLGLLLGRSTKGINAWPNRQKEPLQKIIFEPDEYPTSCGWKFEGIPPNIHHRLDGYAGNVIDIKTEKGYRMDLAVNAPAEIGKNIEYVANLGIEARISVLVLVQSQSMPQSKELWLTFMTGSNPPKRVDNGTWYEYEVYLLPIQLDGGWHKYRVNISDAVRRSAGKEGWRLDRLKAIRVRGNMSLSYLSIL